MKKFLYLLLAAALLLVAACGEDAETTPQVLRPTIDESSITIEPQSGTISFRAECPQGTKLKMLLRQLTNGQDEQLLDVVVMQTGSECYVRLPQLVGGSTYGFLFIGYDSEGAEAFRTQERTISVSKNAGPAAPAMHRLKAHAPTSLVAADGYVEGDEITTLMEYRIDDAQTWTPVAHDGIISDLRPCVLHLRVCETATTEAGKEGVIEVPAYQSNTDLDGHDGTADGMRMPRKR